jgi:hypothetical protein
LDDSSSLLSTSVLEIALANGLKIHD